MQPYPVQLIRQLRLENGSPVTIRPIRPEDAGIEQEFVRNLSDRSRYYRFLDSVRELSPRMLAYFTQVDYLRHMALIAVTGDGALEIQHGVARYIAEDEGSRCEFSIVVADDWQRKGLGTLLMRELIAAARAAGVQQMFGEVFADNHRMLRFTTRLGFSTGLDPADPRMARVTIDL